MNANQAKAYATDYRIPLDTDFHTLNSETVGRILQAAIAHKYRAPRNANGSRARYFYASLCRAAAGPKYRTAYVIQQAYSGVWEDVNAEDNTRDARRSVREYRENMPDYPARIIRRRVLNG